MSEVGADALQGKEESIAGRHTFEVTDQSRVIANGMLVSLTPCGHSEVQKSARTTSKEGWEVKRGDKVMVYNATVVFKKLEELEAV